MLEFVSQSVSIVVQNYGGRLFGYPALLELKLAVLLEYFIYKCIFYQSISMELCIETCGL